MTSGTNLDCWNGVPESGDVNVSSSHCLEYSCLSEGGDLDCVGGHFDSCRINLVEWSLYANKSKPVNKLIGHNIFPCAILFPVYLG